MEEEGWGTPTALGSRPSTTKKGGVLDMVATEDSHITVTRKEGTLQPPQTVREEPVEALLNISQGQHPALGPQA